MAENKRTLKRQLNLVQTIMLGTAGTLGSGIFILTGHAAAVAGPATIIAVIIAGILSFSIAFNYCELATTYPETGGAMTYVREAWGKGLLAFLVGSMDCISSTFYTALSAVGFAYSLSVFIPGLAQNALLIGLVAIAAILVFVALNIAGVSRVGNTQVIMGGILVFAFAVYIIAGFTMPNGFSTATLLPTGKWFASGDPLKNFTIILRTIALIYASYVGFEVIADDAEEIKNPTRNIPLAIMISLGIIILIYTLTVTVALGTLPIDKVAGSETAISDSIRVFLGTPGATLIGLAGMVGSLTSVNSSMLSATRESFTLSRDGSWPTFLSRLNRNRVPYNAILVIGLCAIMVTIIGAVDFLSYITSAGYLFVLLLSNSAMIRLRKKFPYIHRPYKVPLFPLTPILASLICLIVILFSEVKALVFMGALLLLFGIYYFIKLGAEAWRAEHVRSLSPGRYRLIVPVLEDQKLDNVMKIGASIAQNQSDINMCILQVIPWDTEEKKTDVEDLYRSRQYMLEKFINYAVKRNVPMYSKTISGATLSSAILEAVRADHNVRLVLFKCPDNPTQREDFEKTVLEVSHSGLVNVGVLFDKGVKRLENIMVPVGGGYHCKLAVRLAEDLASADEGIVDYLRVVPGDTDPEVYDDQMAYLQEVVMGELGLIPGNANLIISQNDDAAQCILDEAEARKFDLIIIGSAESEQNSGQPLFGNLVERIVHDAPCSTLVIHQHETQAASWLRRQFKPLEK